MSGIRKDKPGVSSSSEPQHRRRLSAARARLIEMMQALNFGRIEHMSVAGGEPLFHPPPKVTRELKFGAGSGVTLELPRSDFLLKSEVRELFDELAAIGDGIVDCIEVRHGLPFRLITSHAPQQEGGAA